jgi:hypothetical protein
MKRVFYTGLVAVAALATSAGAQLMGNGHFWKSGDGGIPHYTPTVDGNVSDMEANAYHLSWAPSDIWAWGDAYGYSRDTDLVSRRIRVYAIDVDNNLYLADGEDPAENGTDVDLTTNYYFSWDENNLYIAANNIDNHYDVVEDRTNGPNDDAFWQRDTFWISIDLSDGTGPNNGNNIVEFRSLPVNIGDAVSVMQVAHYQDGTATQVNYGNDPDYYLGAQHFGGPNATGYYIETSVPWDLIFLFDPDNRSQVGAGFAFRGRFIIPDPDGDDLYGQTYFGGDQGNLGENNRWPRFVLQQNLSAPTAVESSSWGAVKKLYE